MPTIITIDGVTLTLKKYPEFAPGTPIATDITLFSDPVNGDLFKTTMDNLIANILNVDGVTITGDGSIGDPLVSSGILGITSDNAITASSATNVQLGATASGANSPLLHNTFINTTANYYLEVNGSSTYVFRAINTSANYAIYGQASGAGTGIAGVSGADGVGIDGYTSGDGIGIRGNADNGIGVSGFATTGIGGLISISNATTNTTPVVLRISRNTSGTAGNGIGITIEFNPATTTTIANASNQLISKWVDATNATRTSQFIITGVLSASIVDLITLNADGSWQIRPITATAANAITPAEGMMLFVSTTDATFTTIGFWGYANGAWAAF